jgi:hypothetical protein
MPERGDLANPVVTRMTRFDTDESRFDARKQLQHVIPAQSTTQDGLPGFIHSMHLKETLRYVESDHFDGHVPLLFAVANRSLINP